MKINVLGCSAIALLPAAMLVLSSCSSTPEGQSVTMIAAEKGVPGGIIVDTHQTKATVTGIDTANRKVTLVSPDGKKDTIKCGPEVINFDQIQIGDQLKVTVTDELVVYGPSTSSTTRPLFSFPMAPPRQSLSAKTLT
ncbi:MAG: hypothetical protein NT154_26895 [Verrucomicrobia bacterium]|nr:hypothetical protein [Verrucomicrobiota bacterium]